MLPFWPSEAPISEHYSARLQATISPEGTALQNRQPALLAEWRPFKSEIIYFATFLPDNNLLVGTQSKLCIADGSTGLLVSVICDIPVPDHSYESLLISRDVTHLSFILYGVLQVLNIQKTQLVVTIKPRWYPFSRFIAAVLVLSNTHILSLDSGDTIHLWRVDNGELVDGPFGLSLYKGDRLSRTTDVSPDGKYVVVPCRDNNMAIVSISDKSLSLYLQLCYDGSAPHEVGFSSDGQRVISVHTDLTFRIWDAVDGRPLLVYSLRTE
ncbi:unnamed protein product [Rhizoctonia solani]|uniref:Vegetative incompatibility protein HET-E-1 [Podospora anserina] n=1 Tax=Rhizoctonia solani TaxID=456999 RepID=A0A8H3C1Q6_9AGAM|nr:unnamed protein product [Rhizoctonia solani]